MVSCALVLLVLVALWILHRQDALGAVSAVTSVVVAGPVTLLVAIDFGRALRRTDASPTTKLIAQLPQVFLGTIACISALVLTSVLLLRPESSILTKAFGSFVIVGLVVYGISLLRKTN